MDRKKVWYILLIAYVCMIYGNSLMPADISSMESGHFLEMLLKLSSQAGLELFCVEERGEKRASGSGGAGSSGSLCG